MSIRSASVYRLFYTNALAEVRERIAAYDADVADWYENGDGRSPEWVLDDDGYRHVNIGGLGYRYPYCPHGMSLWTDYDNICGGCEDSATPYELARWRAREAFEHFCQRFDWLMTFPADYRSQFPDEYKVLMDATMKLLPTKQ